MTQQHLEQQQQLSITNNNTNTNGTAKRFKE